MLGSTCGVRTAAKGIQRLARLRAASSRRPLSDGRTADIRVWRLLVVVLVAQGARRLILRLVVVAVGLRAGRQAGSHQGRSCRGCGFNGPGRAPRTHHFRQMRHLVVVGDVVSRGSHSCELGDLWGEHGVTQ